MITQAEIAKRAGVSVYTVSCALRGQAQVAAETRARILKLAAEMGYQSNPAAVALAGQRHVKRKLPRTLRLGWFRHRYDTSALAGFQAGCRDLGYEMELIDWRAFANGMAIERALWHRRVEGLVLATAVPEKGLETMWRQMNWDRFSVVKLSRGMPELRFHLIRHSAFDYAALALKRVFGCGYRRVAVLLTESRSREDDAARLGAVLNYRETELPEGACLEWRRVKEFVSDGHTLAEVPWLRPWLQEFRPDAVLAFPWTWVILVEAAGFRCPQHVAFAAILGSQPGDWRLQISGSRAGEDEIARRAVHELHRQIVAGERGQVDFPLEHVIEPYWVEGETLLKKPDATYPRH
jgi:DNA-binding LacI/PurR family transcriptional regulator